MGAIFDVGSMLRRVCRRSIIWLQQMTNNMKYFVQHDPCHIYLPQYSGSYFVYTGSLRCSGYSKKLIYCMGVDHGRNRGQVPPWIWTGGDANANCPPPQILSYRYKNERSVAFKIRQNPFSAGVLPRTPLGELTTLPQIAESAGEGTPSPYPPYSARTHLRRSPCVLPEVQPDLRLWSTGEGIVGNVC